MKVQCHLVGGNAKPHLGREMVGTMGEDANCVWGCMVAGVDENSGPHFWRLTEWTIDPEARILLYVAIVRTCDASPKSRRSGKCVHGCIHHTPTSQNPSPTAAAGFRGVPAPWCRYHNRVERVMRKKVTPCFLLQPEGRGSAKAWSCKLRAKCLSQYQMTIISGER